MEIPPEAKDIINHTELPPEQAVGLEQSEVIKKEKQEILDLTVAITKLKNDNKDYTKKINNRYNKQLGISKNALGLKNLKEQNQEIIKIYTEIKDKPAPERQKEIKNIQVELDGLEAEKKKLEQIINTSPSQEVGKKLGEIKQKIDELSERKNLLEMSLTNPKDFIATLEKAEKNQNLIGDVSYLESKVQKNKETINRYESEKLTLEKIITLRELSTDFISIAPLLNIPNEWEEKYEKFLAQGTKPIPTTFPDGSKGFKAKFKLDAEALKELKKNLGEDEAFIAQKIKELEKEKQGLPPNKHKIISLKILHLQQIQVALKDCNRHLNSKSLNNLLDTLEPYGQKKEAAIKDLKRVERELLLNRIYLETIKGGNKKLTEEEIEARKQEFKNLFPEPLHGAMKNLLNLLDLELSLKPGEITPENTKKIQEFFNILSRYSLLTDKEKENPRGQLLKQELDDSLEEILKIIGPKEQKILTPATPESAETIEISDKDKEKVASNLNEKLKEKLGLAAGLAGWSLLLILVLVFYGLIWTTDKAIGIDARGGTKKK